MKKTKKHSRHFDNQRDGRGHEQKPRHEPKDRYWIYGRHAVISALDSGRKIFRICLTDSVLPEVRNAVSGQHFEVRSAEDIASLLPREAVHQGIAAEVAKLEELSLEDLDLNALSKVALLDQVTDPHNAGAILRSAAAFDIEAVIIPRHGSVGETASMAKAASGALDIVPLVTVGNLAAAIETLKKHDFWIIGLEGAAQTEIDHMPDYQKVALVMGAEGKGMRRLTGDLCDLTVKIPISGKMESLNVSNAAAIAFYALSRRGKK